MRHEVQLMLVILLTALVQLAESQSLPINYHNELEWLTRREEFYHHTTIQLPDNCVHLMGGIFCNRRTAHLPFWFEFDLFLVSYNKSYLDPDEYAKHHNIYITNCYKTFVKRLYFRMLAGTRDYMIEEDADTVLRDEKHQHDKILNVPDNYHAPEQPLERAIRLIKQHLSKVESLNHITCLLKCLDEVDGTAINGVNGPSNGTAVLPYSVTIDYRDQKNVGL